MLTQKELVQSARLCIEAKQYGEAKRILREINHPTAREWERKIDELEASQPPSTSSDTEKQFWSVVQLVIIATAIGFVTTTIFYQLNVIETDTESLNVFGFFTLIWAVAIAAAWWRKE